MKCQDRLGLNISQFLEAALQLSPLVTVEAWVLSQVIDRGFVVDKVALGQVFLRVPYLSECKMTLIFHDNPLNKTCLLRKNILLLISYT
jgi:hypothetical protein